MSSLPNRRSIRLQGYDYAQAGAYFVTLCTVQKQCLIGSMETDGIHLTDAGRIAAESWEWLAAQYPYVELDAWVLMPNHLHGILLLRDDVPGRRKPLGALIGAYKTASTKQINTLRDSPGEVVWQRNYYEHILRGEADLTRVRTYIEHNPARWAEDEENPARA